MSDIERPLLRMAYQHFKGDTYVILGFAIDEKTTEEVVIYSNLNDGITYIRPLKDFFAIHPKFNVPRFQLVTPRVRK